MRTFVFIFILCLPISLFAQHKLSGSIKDSKGNPIENASLQLKGITTKATTSNAKGLFYFTNLASGTYSLIISHISYQPKSIRVLVAKNVHLDIELKEAFYSTEEIVITAIRGKKNTPVPQTLIVKEKIDRDNLGQDLTFLLNHSPSLLVTSDAGAGIGYSGIRIRGTSASRINVTINGVPLNDAESQQVFWVDLPDFSSSVENIQIQRGVGTSTNGTASFGASINIKTDPIREKSYLKSDVSLGSFSSLKQTYQVGTGLIDEKFNAEVRFSNITSDGYIDRAFSKLNSYYVATAYKMPKSLLKFITFSGKEKTYQAWDGIPSSILSNNRKYNAQGVYTDPSGQKKYYDNQTDNYLQTHYQLIYAANLSKHVDANFIAHYTKGEGYYESYREDKKLSDYNLTPMTTQNKSDIIDRRWLDNDFFGGFFSLHLKHEKVNTIIGCSWNKYLGHHFGDVIWSDVGNIPKDYEWYRNKGTKEDFTLYAKLNFQATERLNLYTDLQYRYIDYKISGIDNDLRNITQSHNFSFFQPLLGFLYGINSKQLIYANLAIAHREPNRDNFVDANPSRPSPKSERLTDIELGYTLKNKIQTFTANMYYMNYKDQLVLTGQINDVGSPVMVNIDKSHRLGLELINEIRFSEKFKWNVNATFSQNKIKDLTVYIDDWDSSTQRTESYGKSNLSFSPNVIANSEIYLQATENLKIKLASQYVSKQFVDNTGSENRKLNPYFVSNINISYDVDFLKKCQLKLLVNNIFNEKYETNAWVYRYFENNMEQKLDGYFSQAGTHFLLGVSLEL